MFRRVFNINSHCFPNSRYMGDYCHAEVLFFLSGRRRIFNISCTNFKILLNFCYILSSANLVSEFNSDAAPDQRLSSVACWKLTIFNSQSCFLASFNRKMSGYFLGTFRILKFSVSCYVCSVCYYFVSLSLFISVSVSVCLSFSFSLMKLRISNRHMNGTM